MDWINYLIVAGVLVGLIALVSLIERKSPSLRGIILAVAATSLCAVFALGGAIWLLQNPTYLTVPVVILAMLWVVGRPLSQLMLRWLYREAAKNDSADKPDN